MWHRLPTRLSPLTAHALQAARTGLPVVRGIAGTAWRRSASTTCDVRNSGPREGRCGEPSTRTGRPSARVVLRQWEGMALRGVGSLGLRRRSRRAEPKMRHWLLTRHFVFHSSCVQAVHTSTPVVRGRAGTAWCCSVPSTCDIGNAGPREWRRGEPNRRRAPAALGASVPATRPPVDGMCRSGRERLSRCLSEDHGDSRRGHRSDVSPPPELGNAALVKLDVESRTEGTHRLPLGASCPAAAGRGWLA